MNVLTAQASELSVRSQLEQSRQVYATDLISLYKALGGGWAVDANSNIADTRENRGDVVTANPGPKPAADGRRAPGLVSGPDVAKSGPSSGDVIALHPALNANQIADSQFKIDPVRQDTVALYQSQAVVKPTSDTLSGPQLQLGAWRSETAAMEGWNHATRQAGGLLDGLMPRIVAADLPGKGRYYRLRAGPVNSTDPLQLCKALLAKGLDCILAQD